MGIGFHKNELGKWFFNAMWSHEQLRDDETANQMANAFWVWAKKYDLRVFTDRSSWGMEFYGWTDNETAMCEAKMFWHE